MLGNRGDHTMTITASKEFTFEGAHYLEGSDGKCGHVHGHSYKVTVTVAPTGNPDNTLNAGQQRGMVMDLVAVKEAAQPIIDYYDHALIVERETTVVVHSNTSHPYQQDVGPCDQRPRIRVIDMRPTAENLAVILARDIDNAIHEHSGGAARVCRLRVQETATSYVEVEL